MTTVYETCEKCLSEGKGRAETDLYSDESVAQVKCPHCGDFPRNKNKRCIGCNTNKPMSKKNDLCDKCYAEVVEKGRLNE